MSEADRELWQRFRALSPAALLAITEPWRERVGAAQVDAVDASWDVGVHHGHPKLAAERASAESWIYGEASRQCSIMRSRVIDVGGSAGCVRRRGGEEVWNLFPIVLKDDVARWMEVQPLLDVAGARFTVKGGKQRGCTHRLDNCNCPEIMTGTVRRIFICIHSAYYLKPSDWAKLEHGDIVFSAEHVFKGSSGDLQGEAGWTLEAGGRHGMIRMKTYKHDGTDYWHPNITPYHGGFMVGSKSFVGGIHRMSGTTAIVKYTCFVPGRGGGEFHAELAAVVGLPPWTAGVVVATPPPPLGWGSGLGPIASLGVFGVAVMVAESVKNGLTGLVWGKAVPASDPVDLTADRVFSVLGLETGEEPAVEAVARVQQALVRQERVSAADATAATGRALIRRRYAQWEMRKMLRQDWASRVVLEYWNLSTLWKVGIWFLKSGITLWALRRMYAWARGVDPVETVQAFLRHHLGGLGHGWIRRSKGIARFEAVTQPTADAFKAAARAAAPVGAAAASWTHWLGAMLLQGWHSSESVPASLPLPLD